MPVARRLRPEPIPTPAAPRTYVLDTSVLLADPHAVEQFDEHEVVIPVVVLAELEAKRHHPELGWAARTALRALEDLRLKYGSLLEPLPVNDVGGTVRVELNHRDPDLVPELLRGDNDGRILAVAANLRAEERDVVVVTKDLPLRLRASVLGIGAEEYRAGQAAADPWSGIVHLDDVPPALIDELFAVGAVDCDAHATLRDLAAHTGLVLRNGSQSVLARVRDGRAVRISDSLSAFDVRGRSAEQRIALDLLLDPEVGVVSIAGPAGTGKSVLALAAGLEAVLERRTHRRVVVFRPMHAVGGEALGFLPGDADEKLAPWAAAVWDAVESFCGPEVIEEIRDRNLLEIAPITYVRGRSLHETWVICDEAQNWEALTIATALSRLGEGSRAVLTSDPAQRDNLRVGRYDGIASVVDRLRGNPLFAHVTLSRQERSPIAAMAASLLET